MTNLTLYRVYCTGALNQYAQTWSSTVPTICPIDGTTAIDTNATVALEEIDVGENVNITNADSPYTAGTEGSITCDTTGGNITINLPIVSENIGKVYTIIKNTAGNTVTILPDGSDTIDSQSSATLTINGETLTITGQSDAPNWSSNTSEIAPPTTGERNTASNVGPPNGTVGLFYQKAGTDLQFKSMTGSSRLLILDNQVKRQTKFDVIINDAGTSNQDLWSAQKIISQVSSGGPTGATGPAGFTGPTGPAATNHLLLSNLTNGDSGHTQFALLAGRNGGQTLNGSDLNNENLTLQSNSVNNATGSIDLNCNIVNVSNNLVINSSVEYINAGQMPASFASNTVYVFLGSRTTSTPISLVGLTGVSIIGLSRDSSEINYSGSGAFLTTQDADISIDNLRFIQTNNAGYVLDATNTAKDKLLTITNCEFRNCRNIFDIDGYDLVDIQQNVFTYIQGGSTLGTPLGIFTNNVSKLELNSNELIRWYEEGQPANTNPFAGNLIQINGTCGGHLISSNVIHPRVTQDGINIDSATTFAAGINISANTFVTAGLTTGVVLNTNSNASYDLTAIQEANSALSNLKSVLGMSHLDSTPATTTLTTINTPVNMVFNTGTITVFGDFGVTVDTTTNVGRITYDRVRPVNFQITAIFEVLFVSGSPNNQNTGITIAKNGTSLFSAGAVSYQNLSSQGSAPKQFTFTVIGNAVQNDFFDFQLVSSSLSGSSNFEVRSFLVSGIEI